MTGASNLIQGSCLCGKVTYEVSGDVGEIVHCHCVTCRKAHGSAFSSVAAVQDEDFTLIGEENLNRFESSSGKHRYFCSNCGCPYQILYPRLNSPDVDRNANQRFMQLVCTDDGDHRCEGMPQLDLYQETQLLCAEVTA